jgi:signal recognition particle receptor subunit beta
MATIDVNGREIHAKIVYYGPGLSGKTTNLRNIHERMAPEFRGAMRSIETETERTLFFDFFTVQPLKLGDWSIRYHLYSVPGQVDYVRTRRAILGGADGVVFVADAASEHYQANRTFLTELAEHLDYHGRDLAQFPLVLQYNKMDLPTAASRESLDAELNDFGSPAVDAIAINGNGVRETLSEITTLVTRTL